MSLEAVPPELPTALDLWLRPAAVEIRALPTPRVMFTLTYDGIRPCKPATPTAPDDDDPPRMQRMTRTTSETVVLHSYDDHSRLASITGQPYALDIRVWDAESGAVVERMNHDYTAQTYRLSRGKGWNPRPWVYVIPGSK